MPVTANAAIFGSVTRNSPARTPPSITVVDKLENFSPLLAEYLSIFGRKVVLDSINEPKAGAAGKLFADVSFNPTA